jgi:MarR family transcriptional regulator for hemolysin
MPTNSSTLGFLLHDVARLLRKRFEQHAEGTGLTRSQWHVLALLDQNEGIHQGRLADLMDIEPITLGRILDKLQVLALVERHSHPSDRRVWLLHLTAAAHPKLAQLRKFGDLTRGEALAGISDADRECLSNILRTLKANLTDACVSLVAEQKRASHG